MRFPSFSDLLQTPYDSDKGDPRTPWELMELLEAIESIDGDQLTLRPPRSPLDHPAVVIEAGEQLRSWSPQSEAAGKPVPVELPHEKSLLRLFERGRWEQLGEDLYKVVSGLRNWRFSRVAHELAEAIRRRPKRIFPGKDSPQVRQVLRRAFAGEEERVLRLASQPHLMLPFLALLRRDFEEPAFPESAFYLALQRRFSRLRGQVRQLLDWIDRFPALPDSFFASPGRIYLQAAWEEVWMWLRFPESRQLIKEIPGSALMLCCELPFNDPGFAKLIEDRTDFWQPQHLLGLLGLNPTRRTRRLLSEVSVAHHNKVRQDAHRDSLENARSWPARAYMRPPSAEFIRKVVLALRSHPSVVDKLERLQPEVAAKLLRKVVSLSYLPGQPHLVPSPALFQTLVADQLQHPESFHHFRNEYLSDPEYTLDNFVQAGFEARDLEDELSRKMISRLGRMSSRRKLAELRKRISLFREFDRLMEKYEVLEPLFPVKNPLEGSLPEQWYPLVNLSDLYHDSRELNHCLFTQYVERIALGELFAVSVKDTPKRRATLLLEFDTNYHSWRLLDCHLAGDYPAEWGDTLTKRLTAMVGKLPNTKREQKRRHEK